MVTRLHPSEIRTPNGRQNGREEDRRVGEVPCLDQHGALYHIRRQRGCKGHRQE